jgi:BirA family biotin operon repressor/biotin-[acetyl-CoA-carboxylase] ligase
LTGDQVRTALAGTAMVRRIYAFEELPSTSDWAKALIARGNGSRDLDGTLVIAEQQTAGRGRFDRPWVTPAGKALLFSFVQCADVLDEDQRPSLARRLAVAAPVAVCAAIAETSGPPARIKYPNDVLLNGRKASGILLETVAANGVSFTVLGVGINVNQAAEELPPDTRVPATSIALELGYEVDCAPLLSAFFARLDDLLGNQREAIAQMNLLCETLGSQVRVETAKGIIEGLASGVTDDGALVVRTAAGMSEVVHSGDVVQVNVR